MSEANIEHPSQRIHLARINSNFDNSAGLLINPPQEWFRVPLQFNLECSAAAGKGATNQSKSELMIK
jgi:hypothetical protein